MDSYDDIEKVKRQIVAKVNEALRGVSISMPAVITILENIVADTKVTYYQALIAQAMQQNQQETAEEPDDSNN